MVIPDGYMMDAQGRLVPTDLVKPIDAMRNTLVKDLIVKALRQRDELQLFKAGALGDIQAFVELSSEEYDTQLGGVKGNVSLVSFDGRFKVQRSIGEYISFDERLQVAKNLIDECIHRWSDGARSEIRVLVQDAFQTDKQGHINTARVLGLRRLDIQDPQWIKAMAALSDSIQVQGSKTYIRFYERRGNSDQWYQISLDIAALEDSARAAS